MPRLRRWFGAEAVGIVASGIWSAVGAARACSGEGEFWVEGDVVFFQQGEEFGVEGHFIVMGWLILDVAEDGGDLRGAHAEGGVAFLPRKFVASGVGPAAGIGFDGQDGFGEREGLRKLDQEMDVVGGAADGVGEDSVIFADAGDVGPEVGSLKSMRDGFAAVFGGEDDVQGVLGVGVGHGAGYITWGSAGSRAGMHGVVRGICTYEALFRTYGAPDVCCDGSQAFRPGLSYAAPPALVWRRGHVMRCGYGHVTDVASVAISGGAEHAMLTALRLDRGAGTACRAPTRRRTHG